MEDFQGHTSGGAGQLKSNLVILYEPTFLFQTVEVSEDGGNLPLSELIKSVTVTNNPVST